MSCINCDTKEQEIIPISHIIKYKPLDTYSVIKEAFSKLREYSEDDLDVLISQELTFNDFKVLKLRFKKNLQDIPTQFFYLINDIKEISPDFSIEYLLNHFDSTTTSILLQDADLLYSLDDKICEYSENLEALQEMPTAEEIKETVILKIKASLTEKNHISSDNETLDDSEDTRYKLNCCIL